MARARNIKPSFFKNELLGVADPLLSLLFVSLWQLADKEGRLEDRPLRIKAETFPYRDGVDVNGYLTELERLGFIQRYWVNDLALIQVVNFRKHQTPHKTEKPSVLPGPGGKTLVSEPVADVTVKQPLSNVEETAPLPPDSLLLTPDSLTPEATAHPPGLNASAWEKWLSYRKQIRKPLKQASIPAAQQALAAFGSDQEAVVQQSIANGYQGLFPLKNGGSREASERIDNSAPARVQRANERRERERREREGPAEFAERVD